MAAKKVKPIAIIYEVPHIPKVRQALSNLRDEMQKDGWQVFFNNPQPYTSDQVFKKAELCIYYDESSTAHAKQIMADYLDAKISVMDYKEVTDFLATRAKAKQAVDSKQPSAKSK